MALTLTGNVARAATDQLVAALGMTVVELTADAITPELRNVHMGHMVRLDDGRTIVAVPAGQDPVDRLVTITKLAEHLERAA